MSRNQRHKRVRTRFWNENPYCRNCGVVTILPEYITDKNPPHNMATIQHIRSRLNLDRPTIGKNNTPNLTLWCNKCNFEDGKQEYDAFSLEEKWKRTKQTPVLVGLDRLIYDPHFF